jgi:endonuclease-3
MSQTTPKPSTRRKLKRRTKADPIKPWAKRLKASRPGLVEDVLDGVQSLYGVPVWRRTLDPMSELILTILTQNSADINAEKAFDVLRRSYPGDASTMPAEAAPIEDRPGWGGSGWERLPPPDWMQVETAPLDELVDVIRSAGLANQKAPRIQASLRRVREATGSHSLEFLGEMEPLEARAWLTAIDGVGVKTASVVLMMSFGMPLMPVDRHVDRVSERIGLMPSKVSAEEAHDRYLALLDPEQCYPMHVGLITHGRQKCHKRLPDCDTCPLAPRCRFVDRRAP